MNTPTATEEPRAATDSRTDGTIATEEPRKEDLELQRDVMDEIAMEPSVDAALIGVSVKDGIVVLSGHVNSYVEKDAAERAAKRVRGVRAVVNEIRIKPLEDPPSDEEIAEEVVRNLRSHLLTTALGIRVTVRDGVVTLEGEVQWQHQKLNAAAVIRHLPGVRDVVNLIEVKPRVEPGEIKTLIARAHQAKRPGGSQRHQDRGGRQQGHPARERPLAAREGTGRAGGLGGRRGPERR